MKRIFSKTAFTLIELIVSGLLVTVVLFGIISIQMVLSNNNQDYGQRYLVKSQTQTTLNRILNDAALAVGSAANTGTPSVPDLGIVIGAQMGPGLNNNSFCMHQQPNGSGSDIWACYKLDTNAASATYQQVLYCNKTYNPNDATGYRGSNGACNPPSWQFLGTANSITQTAGTTLPSSPYFNTSGPLLFSINILNCLNNSASSCNGSGMGVSSDPTGNPEVQLSGSVIPSQESM